MPFLSEFCQLFDSYSERRLELSNLVDIDLDEPDFEVPGLALQVKEEFVSARQSLWQFLEQHDFSNNWKADIPNLAELGINSERRQHFLKVLRWLLAPKDMTLEAESKSAFELLANGIGYQTYSNHRLRGRLKEISESAEVHDGEITMGQSKRALYAYDLEFDSDEHQVWRHDSERVQLPPKHFEFLFSVADRMRSRSRYPTRELYEKLEGRSPPKILPNTFYQLSVGINKVIGPELGVMIRSEHSKGYTITDELPPEH